MLETSDLSRMIGSKSLVSGVSLSIEVSGTLAVVGPSGSGKTSLLRLLAGLDAPTSGSISWNGEAISVEGRVIRAPEARKFGMVFQDSALFPHLSVSGNVSFGIKAPLSITDCLESYGLMELKNRAVHSLSGGERQRVALARAMATSPEVLLLDEPFSNIDRLARHGLIETLKRALKGRKTTVVLVTHDARDAVDLGCDKLLVLNQGRVASFGSLTESLKSRGSGWLEEFLNCCLGTERPEGARR